jgi:hypothetical protein
MKFAFAFSRRWPRLGLRGQDVCSTSNQHDERHPEISDLPGNYLR